MKALYTGAAHNVSNEMENYEQCLANMEDLDIKFMQKMDEISQDVREYTSDPSNKLNDPEYFEKAKQKIWNMNKHWDMQVREITAQIGKQLQKMESKQTSMNDELKLQAKIKKMKLRRRKYNEASKQCRNLSYMLQIDKCYEKMKNIKTPSLSENKYKFTDDRIRAMQDKIIERRLKELELEKAQQEKHLREAKMLNVVKFFKRYEFSKGTTDIACCVTPGEFQALKEGLELYGIKDEKFIAEMEKDLLQGEKIEHYKNEIKK